VWVCWHSSPGLEGSGPDNFCETSEMFQAAKRKEPTDIPTINAHNFFQRKNYLV
jgi:hypothetical protein